MFYDNRHADIGGINLLVFYHHLMDNRDLAKRSLGATNASLIDLPTLSVVPVSIGGIITSHCFY
jgi:hypothetical protein